MVRQVPQEVKVLQQIGTLTQELDEEHQVVLGAVQTQLPHWSKLLGQIEGMVAHWLVAAHQVKPTLRVRHLPHPSVV